MHATIVEMRKKVCSAFLWAREQTKRDDNDISTLLYVGLCHYFLCIEMMREAEMYAHTLFHSSINCFVNWIAWLGIRADNIVRHSNNDTAPFVTVKRWRCISRQLKQKVHTFPWTKQETFSFRNRNKLMEFLAHPFAYSKNCLNLLEDAVARRCCWELLHAATFVQFHIFVWV